MRMRNGVRAWGLAAGAWFLTWGSVGAQSICEDDTPPAELFSFQTCEHCADCPCQQQSAFGVAQWDCDITSFNWSLAGIIEAAKPFCDPWSADATIQPVWHGELICSECPGECAAAQCAESSNASPWAPAIAYPHYHTRGPRDFITAEQTAPAADLTEGEPAQVLLGIRQRVGGAPLSGTAFDGAGCEKAENTFINTVRESVEHAITVSDCSADACMCVEASPEFPEQEAAAEKPRDASIVPLLRLISRNLEQSANMLEDSEMYFRADELRDLAAELRLEARTAGKAWSLEPLGQVQQQHAPEPERDLQNENEELRAELERLRETLRASHEDATKLTR